MGATIKQRRAFKDTLENLSRKKPKTKQQILLAAGYSPNVAKMPPVIERSKGWQELMDQYLPEEDLAKVHREGLAATKITNILTAPDLVIPDYAVRHKYLETGYKVRGKLKDNDGSGNILNINILSIEQQQRIARRIQTGLSEIEGAPDRLLDSDQPQI